METIKGLLNTELQTEIEKLSDLELGSEQHKSAVEAVAKLSDRYIEMVKIDNDQLAKDEARKREDEKRELEQNKLAFEKRKFESEMCEKRDSRKEENEFKLTQRKSDWIFKIIEIGVPIVTFAIGIRMKTKWTRECLKFEETGTVTTMAGKAHCNSLFR